MATIFPEIWAAIISIFPEAPLWVEKVTLEFPNLLIYAFAMASYGIFIYLFYRQLARRDIFPVKLRKFEVQEEGVIKRRSILNDALDWLAYVLKYTVFFPIYTSLWFFILSAFLFVMSESQDVGSILLTSITMVSATRITAYYNEDLSKDFAKLLPFVLLGVFMVNPSTLSVGLVASRIQQAVLNAEKSIVFILFAVLLEWTLRLMLSFSNLLRGIS